MNTRWTAFRQRIGLLKSVVMYYWRPFSQRKLRQFYRRMIRPGDLCFDIGAHVGHRTKAMTSIGAHVVAVDPQPACAAFLRSKFKEHKTVTVEEVALGDHCGKAIFHISPANPTISTISGTGWRDQLYRDGRYPVQWDVQAEVEMTTLDALIEQYGMPVYCKMDIENAEHVALRGLSQPLPLLSFEFYPPYPQDALHCLNLLERLGRYQYNWAFGESCRFFFDDWISQEAMRMFLSGLSGRRHYGDVFARLVV